MRSRFKIAAVSALARRRPAQAGQAMVLAVLTLSTILGFTAVAMDIGRFEGQRRRMQSAADSAALAGARELQNGVTSEVVAAAQNDAGLNGFANGSSNVTVTVNNPPLSGGYAGNSYAVEVIVSEPQPTYFLRAIGIDTVSISARAVAALTSSPNCIYSLNPTDSDTIYIDGAISLSSGCGLMDDSNSDSAMSVNGAVTLNTGGIGVVGNYSSWGAIQMSPQPVTGIAPGNDPLAYIQAPAVGSCDYTHEQINGGSVTLSPGTYCGGISASASNIALNPGTYILDGGGLNLSEVTTLRGTGVTFYDTEGYSGYAGINVSGASLIDLSAPTSGPLEGILFFQDRDISEATAEANPSIFDGASNSTYQGTLYFPSTAVEYYGAAEAAYTLLVANKVSFEGAMNLAIGNNYSSLQNGSPIKTAVLVE